MPIWLNPLLKAARGNAGRLPAHFAPFATQSSQPSSWHRRGEFGEPEPSLGAVSTRSTLLHGLSRAPAPLPGGNPPPFAFQSSQCNQLEWKSCNFPVYSPDVVAATGAAHSAGSRTQRHLLQRRLCAAGPGAGFGPTAGSAAPLPGLWHCRWLRVLAIPWCLHARLCPSLESSRSWVPSPTRVSPHGSGWRRGRRLARLGEQTTTKKPPPRDN